MTWWIVASPLILFVGYVCIRTALLAAVLLWRTGVVLAADISDRTSKAIVGGIVTGVALGAFMVGVQISRAVAPAKRILKLAQDRKEQQGDAQGKPQDRPENDVQRAMEILGLPEGFTKADLIFRFREMARRNHTDNGGSKYMMQQINWANGVLKGRV